MADRAGVEGRGSLADLNQIIISAAADGIVAVDDDGVVVACNPAAEELFSRSAADLVGGLFGYPLGEAVTEISLVLPGGSTRTVEMRVSSTTWNAKPLRVAALRDVTRRRQVEQDLEAALLRRNVAVEVTAHQVRNPIAAIRTLVDVLRDRSVTLSEEQRIDMLDQIAERITHVQALGRNLLVASRIEATGAAVAPEPVPVLQVLLERVAHVGEQPREVRLSCPPDLVALVDRFEFGEMLTNYLDNARTHGRPPIDIRAVGVDNHIEVRVTDAGPGVPDALVPVLFDRFTRGTPADRETEGMGLGLWIVRTLARANGGDAWYEPAGDGGSCFVLKVRRGDSIAQAGDA